MLPPVPSYDGLRCPYPLRKHQREALAALDRARRDGSTRWWITMPPGAGKSLVGTEAARLLGRRSVVFSPNTAIQGQWQRTWNSYGRHAPAGLSRDLCTAFTSLTYQSLAVFDDDEDPDADADSPLGRLHDNGLWLIDRMKQAGPLTVVLDECHHLLETWGELLRDVLDQLPQAQVVGLTATPPASMTASQAALTSELFGPILYEARIPALVKEGTLAPYAELAWLVEPTTEERSWLRNQSVRFAELTADLFDPTFGSTSFPVWLAQRFTEPVRVDGGTTTWDALSGQEPLLTDAYLRLVHAGLATLPDGARLREPHRHDPAAGDWIDLLEDWLEGCILPGSRNPETGQADQAVLAAVRRTLPAIGYVLTRHGIRAGRGLVDRVVARSAAKQQAVATIAHEEAANLGEEARVLVLCDHEQATATSQRRLRDGEDAAPDPAGSARGVLDTLRRDPGSAVLGPLLVTGRTVAGDPGTLAALREHVRCQDPELADQLIITDDELSGPWQSGTWVRHATSFFAAGGTRCLVGTRGLLGEGWDAPAITCLVDVTTVTTSTAVVQTRGRALRIDPARPEKVALVWTVVCVSDEHVAGGNDWDRFVRKHVGYFTADETGTVIDGVAGVDSRFSPFEPPAPATFAAVNADMLERAGRRHQVRDAWLRLPAYADAVRHVLRVLPDRTPPPGRPGVLDVASDPDALAWANAQRLPLPRGWLLAAGLAPALLVAALVVLPLPAAVAVIAAGSALAVAVGVTLAARHGQRELEWESRRRLTLQHVALAVADALRATGRSTVGAEAVRVGTRPDGTAMVDLVGADETATADFTEALEELAAPMAEPRHVVPCPVTLPPARFDVRRNLRVATARGFSPDAETWHPVPSLLSRRKADREEFLRAWRHWVGGDRMVATSTPEGAGIVATHRFEDPFGVTCAVRRVWS